MPTIDPNYFVLRFWAPLIVLFYLVPTGHNSDKIEMYFLFCHPRNKLILWLLIFIYISKCYKEAQTEFYNSYSFLHLYSHELYQCITDKSTLSACFSCQFFSQSLEKEETKRLLLDQSWGQESENMECYSFSMFFCWIGLIFRIISEAALIWAKPLVIETSFSALTLYCISWLSFWNGFVLLEQNKYKSFTWKV